MFPADHKPIPVAIEYDGTKSRVTRQFADAYVARRFYVSCYKQGKNPKVRRSSTMPQVTETTTPATVATEAPKAKATKPAKTTKKPVAKASAKPVAKKPAAKKAAAPAVHGTERDHDLPWNDKKVAIFKALKSLKAIGATSAVSGSAVAEKANVSGRDVRHYSYHAKAAGLIGLADIEDVHGYAYYLTAKGAKLDPVTELKAQNKDK